MRYTTEQKNQAARALVSHLPGLDLKVARAWVTAEQGENYNILGLRRNKKLMTFDSFDEAAAEIAAVISTSRYYRELYRAIVMGSPLEQAWAIVRSPWHLGPTGVKKAGGYDPYYLRVFVSQGVIPPLTIPPGWKW
jgi:hypothetical protein